mmetsp:Transcript_11173/g.20915  ORF Transcript_11173/g.20915 Transcript_11173/m.20915 type:complete len:141 (-) Transcript_11173:183-605(-)
MGWVLGSYTRKDRNVFDLSTSNISNVDMSQEKNNAADGDDDINAGNVTFRHMFLEKNMYAVVWSARSLYFPHEVDTDYHYPLNLGYRVQLEDCRRIIPINAFVKPCFGMLNMCGLPGEFDNTAIILKDRSKWAEFFLLPH